MNECQFIKSEGQKCEAKPIKGDNFCFWHSTNPDVIEMRKLAVSNGGLANRYELDSPEWKYENSKSIVQLLELCINKVLRGSMPPKVANSVAYLGNALLTTIKETETEQRLEALEYGLKIKKQTK